MGLYFISDPDGYWIEVTPLSTNFPTIPCCIHIGVGECLLISLGRRGSDDPEFLEESSGTSR